MVEPLILGRVAAGNKPKTVVLGSVAQQQANNSAYASTLATAAQPSGTSSQGTSWGTYLIIAVVVIVIGYYLYNRRGGNSR